MTTESNKALIVVREVRRNLETSSWLTPVNLTIEKERFFQSKHYNPQLIYPELPVDQLNGYLKQLIEIELDQSLSLEARIMGRKIEELQLIITLLLSRGTESLGPISHKLYGCSYLPEMLAVALKDSELPGEFKPLETASREEISIKIYGYLANMGLTDWRVKLTDLNDFYFRVKYKQKEIWMGKEINWDFCDLDNTLAHEIDGHVVRAVNMQKQAEPLFQEPWPFYLKTEEGLASYLGDYLSPVTALISRKHHALKYLAGHLAQTTSFRETYNFFVENGFTSSLAFRRTFRLKRGLEDTAMPGANGRESMYYQGMMEVKDYIDNGGSIPKLFGGKFGLEDLDLVPIPENQLIPKRVRNYL